MPETRVYRHAADELTLNALHHLRAPWRGWERGEDGTVRVQTTDGVVVRLGIRHGEPEPGLTVRSIAAEFVSGAVRPVREVPGFDRGGNDVVVFDGESWLTPLVQHPDAHAPMAVPIAEFAAARPLLTHGQPHERPARVEAHCSTTDGVLVASPRGLSWLARIGVHHDELEVTTDAAAVRAFLASRGVR
jgi:hypothetical protein